MLLLTSGAVTALTCLCYFAYEIFTFHRATVSSLVTLGEVIASNSTASLAFNSREDAQQILGALKANPHIISAGLYTGDGRIFVRYPLDVREGLVPESPQADGYRFTADGIAFFQPVTGNGKRLGTLYLCCDRTAMYERLRLYTVVVLFVIAASFGLAYVVSRSLQRQISEPILALADTARLVSDRNDYSLRATRFGNDEVGQLTAAFNRMLEQIQQLNRELEQRVAERTAELRAANQELEAFSYSVSHDLRAPLRHVGGFATMLQKHLGDGLDEKAQRYVNVIQTSTARMGQLIDDLLAFSRHGRAELRRQPVQLDALMAEIQQELEADSAGRQIIWSITPLPVVTGDLALLRQVFANLLGNAVKYSRKQSQARIEVGLRPSEPSEAVIYIRDNGAGFEMKYVDKLFGVFQRLHQDDEFEGTGVGLATVRRIVQRHGGRVWAEGKVGAGATFYVSLPLGAGNSASAAAAAREPNS